MLEKRWVLALKKFNEGKEHKSPSENDKEADIEFLRLLEEQWKQEEEKDPSYKTIPRFFYKKPAAENSLYFRVRQEARTRFL